MSNLNIEPLNLLLKDVSSGASNLFDALQEAQLGRFEVEGVGTCQLLHVNIIADSDPACYYQMIEQTPYQGCAYTLLLLLVRDYFYCESNERFERIIHHAGPKGLAFIIKALLAEYVNPQRISQDNSPLVMQILRNRADVRPILMLVTVLVLIYETQGALDEADVNPPGSVIRQRKMGLLRKVLDEFNCKGAISNSEFVRLFGIENLWDADLMCRVEETGKSLLFDERYAAALMVARQLELELSDHDYEELALDALFYNSRASCWQTKHWRTLSVYIADTIAGLQEVGSVWKNVSTMAVQTLHRQSHQYYLGDSGNGLCSELYLCMLPNLIYNLLSEKKVDLAVKVWERAWNECLTALYSWTLPIVPFHVAQLLFYHKVMDMPSDVCSKSSVQMLNELPSVFLPGGCIESTANACLSTLARNCRELERIRLYDPLLYQKLEHPHAVCK